MQNRWMSSYNLKSEINYFVRKGINVLIQLYIELAFSEFTHVLV